MDGLTLVSGSGCNRGRWCSTRCPIRSPALPSRHPGPTTLLYLLPHTGPSKYPNASFRMKSVLFGLTAEHLSERKCRGQIVGGLKVSGRVTA